MTKPDGPSSSTQPQQRSPRDARQQRLAAELRANLKKRKALSKVKAAATTAGRDSPAIPESEQ